MGINGRSDSSLRRSPSAWRQQALQFAEEALAAAFRLDVRDWAGEKNFRLALEDVEGCRTELAFPADNFSCLEVPLYDCLLIEFKECSGDILENRQLQQFGGIEHVSVAELGADDTLVGKRSGRT